MKSARLEWCLADLPAAKKLLTQAIEKYPESPKLYMMLGQILGQEGQHDAARRAFVDGVSGTASGLPRRELQIRRCPTSIPLWIELSRFEEAQNQLIKARSDLEKARLRNPKNEFLWYVKRRFSDS
jgi:pre-mRNA-processing factor 6